MSKAICQRCGAFRSPTAPCKRCDNLNLLPDEQVKLRDTPDKQAMGKHIKFHATFLPLPSKESQ